MTPELQTVAIFGSEGDWGKKTGQLYEEAGYTDRIGCDLKDPASIPAVEAIRRADIVHFSLPPAEIPLVIKEAGIQAFLGKKVIDNAGEKDQLIEQYKRLDKIGVSVCSTHPNCIPTQPLKNQTIMMMEVGPNSGPATAVALEIHRGAGMIPVPLQLKDHDLYMDINQYLPHLINRAYAETLADLAEKYGLDLKVVDQLSTANSTLSRIAMWRTEVLKPEISAQIVRLDNPRRGDIALTLTENITGISQTASPNILKERFSKTAEELDPTGQIRTEKLAETTAILEEVANLKAESVTVTIPVDRAGALIEVLIPFADAGISIDAIQSHKTNGAVEFRLGIKGIHEDQELLDYVARGISATGATLTP